MSCGKRSLRKDLWSEFHCMAMSWIVHAVVQLTAYLVVANNVDPTSAKWFCTGLLVAWIMWEWLNIEQKRRRVLWLEEISNRKLGELSWLVWLDMVGDLVGPIGVTIWSWVIV